MASEMKMDLEAIRKRERECLPLKMPALVCRVVHQDVPDLIAEVERLRAEYDDARKALTIAHGRLWVAGLDKHPGEDDDDFVSGDDLAFDGPMPAPSAKALP